MATRETTIKLSVSDNFSQQLRNFASAIDKADTETKQLAKSTQDAAKGSSQLASGLGQIAGGLGLTLGIAGVTAAVVGLGKQSIELGMKMEQTRIAFTTLTGSADLAQQHLEDLAAFAAKTPFQFDDLVTASRRLQAFGFETSQILPMLTDIGDAAAAMGASADTINRVTLAIGQMSSKGKVSAQEMLQLTEAGIPAWRYLAQSVGVTTAEVQKMTEKGLIPADKAIQAILKGMREDFGGQMAEQSKTAAGAVSNLTDNFTQLLTIIGEKANPAVEGFANVMSDRLALLILETKGLEEGWIDAGDVARIHFGGGLVFAGDEIERLKAKQDAYNKTQENSTDEMMKFLNVLNGGVEDTFNYGEAVADTGTNWEKVFNTMLNGGKLTISQYSELFEILQSGAEDSEKKITKMLETIQDDRIKAVLDDIRTMTQGSLGNENQDYIDAQADLRLKIAEVNEELEKYKGLQGQTITVTEDATVTANELALAQYNAGKSGYELSEAQKRLAENTDPNKQYELEGAVLRAQVALEKANERAGEYSTQMGTSSEVTLDFSGKIGDLEGDLGLLEGAFEDNADAHDDATKRILFNILQQRLAMDGWTDAELDLLTEAGEQWGIFDKDTVKALKGVDSALKDFNEGNVNDTIVKLAAVFGFPDSKTYRINVDYSGPEAGDAGLSGGTASAPTNPGGSGGTTTTGGSQGQQAIGGDYTVSRPTTFTAGEAGTEEVSIKRVGDKDKPSKGGVTQYNTFNVTNPMDMDMALMQLAEKARMN